MVEYVGRDGDDAREKGLESLDACACGVLNLDHDVGTAEERAAIAQIMNATAMQSRRLKNNPAYHFSVSWVEGEHPTREQCEAMVEHFVNGLGMAECETFWALHQDTDNDHVHVIVNTVHPQKGIVVGPPRFDYRVLAKLAREVELAQGWSRDAGYYVTVDLDNGESTIMRRHEAIKRGLWREDETRRPPITMSATRAEKNLGGDSFQTWVADTPARALKAVLSRSGATWNDAHAALAPFGVTLATKGSGMVVKTTMADGREVVAKASQLGRWASKAELEKKLGPYQAPQQQAPQQPIRADAGEQRSAYARHVAAQRREVGGPRNERERDAARLAKREARAQARRDLAERFEHDQANAKAARRAARPVLRERHKIEREALRADLHVRGQQFRAERKAAGQDRVITRSLWAYQAAAEREMLQKRQATERRALALNSPRAQVWREWLELEAQKGDEAALAALRGIRYREQRAKKRVENAIEGEELDRQEALTVAALNAEVDQRRQLVIYRGVDGLERFVDMGPRIVMRDTGDDSLEAALRMAGQKFGGQVDIAGSAEFRERAARQATRLGMMVRDEDLAAIVRDEQAKFRRRGQGPGRASNRFER